MKNPARVKFLKLSMSETSSSKLDKQITPFRALMLSKTASPIPPNRSLPTGLKISCSRKNECSPAAPSTPHNLVKYFFFNLNFFVVTKSDTKKSFRTYDILHIFYLNWPLGLFNLQVVMSVCVCPPPTPLPWGIYKA